MAEGAPLHEARALLLQFARSPLKSLHVRSTTLEVFASRDPAVRFSAEAPVPASSVETVDLHAPHVGTVARLAAIGTAVAAGDEYGALAVLDEERPLIADRVGTIAEHRRGAGDLVECGDVVALIAA